MAFFGKTGFVLSAGFLLAGGILFGIGAANGGTEQVRAMVENGELSIGRNRPLYSTDCNYLDEAELYMGMEDREWLLSSEQVAEVMEITQNEMADAEYWEYEEKGIELAKKDEIRKLSIDWNKSFNICLTAGDSFQIMPMDSFETIDYKVEGDTLKIFSKNSSVEEGMLYIPADWIGEEIDISVAAGCVYSDVLQADKIEIDIGAGYMEGTSMVADQFDVEVASGSLLLNELHAKDAEIEIGLGCAEIMNGTITEDLDVNCGVGQLVLYLTGKESDHNYKVSAIGDLIIGNYNHSGFHSDYEINNHASSDFSINCGLGSINIYFE